MDGLTTNLSRRKRLRWVLYITFLLFALLLIRIAFIQFVQGEELQAMAYQQQSLDRNITPKRGSIYDATGKVELAVSASVETVTVNPVNIPEEQKEKVAKKLAEIFELDYEVTLKKVKKRSSIETIAKRVDKAKTDTLRVWMEENNIKTGINIDEDTKRYYPFNNLASQIIGFCGSDNQGLEGLESYYEENLKGESGKIVRVSDARGGEIQDEAEQYIPAVDGDSLVLTIDATIQGIVEKYLKLGCIDNACTDGGSVIIMNPNNGGSPLNAHHRCGQCSLNSLICREIQRQANYRLSGRSKQDGISKCLHFLQPPDHLQILFISFPEPNPRVQDDLLLFYSRSLCNPQRLF